MDARTAEILLGMRFGRRAENTSRSYFSPVASIDEPITWENGSVCNLYPPSKSAGRSPPQTPDQRSSPSVPPLNQGNSRRGSSFPAQRNNLLSWMKPPPARPSADSTPQSAMQRPPDTTFSSPSHPITRTATPDPTQSTTNTTPAAVHPNTTPIPAVISPTPAATASAPASPAPSERTAFKLAKQLRRFQGYTHKQHSGADRLHQEHHQHPDVHSKCSSLRQITTILRGEYDGGMPLPDVLSSPRLIKPADLHSLNCQSAFKGTSTSAFPEDVRSRDENLPRNLCLSQHHSVSNKNRPAKITFDVDSICSFPSSLAIAQQGINWFPKPHPFLNLSADIHFGLKVPAYNGRGDLTKKYVPLHKIPHYCFRSVIGMDLLLIYIFFPTLHIESDYEHSTYLSYQNQQLWYDAVLSPTLKKTIKCSNILQHYPASAHVTELDSTMLSAESLTRKESIRAQLLNLTSVFGRWEERWFKVTNPQFYNKNHTYVDLVKQVTSKDSALPYNQIPDNRKAEVFLWRKCYLKAYAQTREVLNTNSSQAKGNAKHTMYLFTMMRDMMDQTLFTLSYREKSMDGLIYS
ncbi:hypothetical protein K469DRAFT_697471 [Zopfia rhizophila CBS 207.26]|uniref:Uncharacterized protein n=1 Tax=Zopfia rhizophila CBS 207.26 TaxID=1314779 RepID=A0A6A6DG17_9PEZI|nr:hypothetical protein K469DRAFT_697471 [Zopfia rhizophila CBS 207.26]